jgi:3-phytase
MVDSGMKFYRRYESLSRKNIPFIRASGEGRVVASAEKFIEGFQRAKNKYTRAREHQASPVVNVGISGNNTYNNTYNNTLDDSICAAFETSNLADEIVANFTALV